MAADNGDDVIIADLPETEVDDPSAPGKPLAGAPVGLNPLDATLDAFVSEAGLLSSLSQGSFQHLLSGMRANTGALRGRYLFEVQAIEHGPRELSELRVGLSAAGSSLFLGDGSPDNMCFDWSGTFHFAEPGLATPHRLTGACRPLGRQVVGLLVNLEERGPNANTVSVFLDGRRAGKPQPIPSHLRGRALFPSVTFKNLTLAVNFGVGERRMSKFPFACKMFSCLDVKHAERSALGPPQQRQVVVPVGLPDEGIFDFVHRFLHEHPDFTELSDRMLEQWCVKSGLKKKSAPGSLHSRDRPDFGFGIANIDGRTWRTMLRTLAQLSNRNIICVQVESNLQRNEREQFLSLFPKSVKKVAAVAVGEPSKQFKDWVHARLREDWETQKHQVERRRSMAEAAGEEVAESDLQVPPKPVIDASVVFLPRGGTGVPDMSEKAVACTLAKVAVPLTEEGFDEVRYEWLPKEAADAHVNKWVSSQKASLIVEGLVPGSWFVQGLAEWHALRSKLREKHQAYATKRKQMKDDGIDLEDAALDYLDLASVTDVHNADGGGSPLYGHFKYEDWIILAWRVELHLLFHAFLRDADDTERTGIPEAHVDHYFQVYFKMKLDPRKVAADGLDRVLKVLKGPMELLDHKGVKMLRSKLGAEVPWEDFVKEAEKYRRDRMRRIDAGDESAHLTFPRAAPKAGAKGAGKGVAKAAPTVTVSIAGVKRPAPPSAEAPEAKRPRPEAPETIAKAPISKAPATKAPVAKSPVAKAPVAKMAPVAKVAISKAPVAKAPVAKVAVTKAPVAKTVVKINVAKAPVAKHRPV